MTVASERSNLRQQSLSGYSQSPYVVEFPCLWGYFAVKMRRLSDSHKAAKRLARIRLITYELLAKITNDSFASRERCRKIVWELLDLLKEEDTHKRATPAPRSSDVSKSIGPRL